MGHLGNENFYFRNYPIRRFISRTLFDLLRFHDEFRERLRAKNRVAKVKVIRRGLVKSAMGSLASRSKQITLYEHNNN